MAEPAGLAHNVTTRWHIKVAPWNLTSAARGARSETSARATELNRARHRGPGTSSDQFGHRAMTADVVLQSGPGANRLNPTREVVAPHGVILAAPESMLHYYGALVLDTARHA